MKSLFLSFFLFLSYSNADETPAIYRITNANARAITITVDCYFSARYYAMFRTSIQFTEGDRPMTATRVTYSPDAYDTCEQAKQNGHASEGYPVTFLQDFSAVKNSDLEVELIGHRVFCSKKFMNLYMSGTEESRIARWTTGKTYVPCP